MKNKYYPKPPLVVVFGSILSLYLCTKMYLWWVASNSWMAVLLALVFFLLFILFFNPILEWRTVAIDDEFLIVNKRLYKPIKVNIPDSIYEIKMINEKIYSFYFRLDENYFIIAPNNYTKSNQLFNQIMAILRDKKIPIKNLIS